MPDNQESSYLKGDAKLLERIRNRYDYVVEQWREIRKEANRDMEFISGNPWPEKERIKREQAVRPMLVFDELSQYTNQLINDVRQNKRAVKVSPKGYGADDKTAELRADKIREIEYRSRAQTAYTCAFENACNRSYGGWKITREYVSPDSFDQELCIVRIPNPDTSLPDPDCKKADYSDAMDWFLLDLVPRKEYKRKYPEATIGDFTADHMNLAPAWIKENQIVVAEYWCVEIKHVRMVQVMGPDKKPMTLKGDEIPKGLDQDSILNERTSEERSVVQYITNGVEILEENPQPGKYIPIVWLTGKELYVNDGSGPKRMLMSMIRLARDPQMMVNYYRTAEAEVVGMTPKTPVIAYENQLVNEEDWQAINTAPKAVLFAKARTDATGEAILPFPQRHPYEPQIQPLEMGAESARRAIQAAMGLSALPTNVQQLNNKSGVALDKIDQNEDRGSFHFIDNFEMALEYSGRILDDLIPFVYDAERETAFRMKDDKHVVRKINQETTDEDGQPVNYDMTEGDHEVTISTGPSDQSERDGAEKFVEQALPEIEQLPLDPLTKAKFVALLIKLKNLGPVGDEMQELLNPQQAGNQAQAQLAQQQQQLQQAMEQAGNLAAEVQKLQLEKQGKIIDNQFMLKKAEMDNKLKLDIAEIQAQHQDANARAALTQDLLKELHVSAHEAAQTAVQQAHEKFQADQNRAHQLGMSAVGAAQKSDQANQAHEQAQQIQAQAESNAGAGEQP